MWPRTQEQGNPFRRGLAIEKQRIFPVGQSSEGQSAFPNAGKIYLYDRDGAQYIEGDTARYQAGATWWQIPGQLFVAGPPLNQIETQRCTRNSASFLNPESSKLDTDTLT